MRADNSLSGHAEIFLHLLGRYAGEKRADQFKGVPADVIASAAAADGDGMAPPRCVLHSVASNTSRLGLYHISMTIALLCTGMRLSADRRGCRLSSAWQLP